jgi:flagellar FliL protein
LAESAHAAARQIRACETIHPAKVSGLLALGKVPLTIGTLGYLQGCGSARGADRQADRRHHEGSDMAAKAKKAEIEEDEAEAGNGEEATEAAKAKGKFPLTLIMIVAAAVVVLGGGGTAGYLMLGGAGNAKPAAVVVKPPAFLDVPEILVNLSTGSGERTQYLKVKVVLELPDVTMQPQVQTTLPRVMDAFQTYLRELRPADLDGSAGLYRLKEELTRRVNVAIAPSRINAILFKEIVVQ